MVKGVKDNGLCLQPTASPGTKSEGHFLEVKAVLDVLEKQQVLIFKSHSHIYNLLTRKIASNCESTNGQEYEQSANEQGKIKAHSQVYGVLLAGHREVLTSEVRMLYVLPVISLIDLPLPIAGTYEVPCVPKMIFTIISDLHTRIYRTLVFQ